MACSDEVASADHTTVPGLAPGCSPLCTSDGLDLYCYALTAHVGQWVQTVGEKKRQWPVAAELLYGEVKKSYRRRKLAKVERRMRWGTWKAFEAKVQALGVSRTLDTAFVERLNLTIRRGIAALQRRSWSTMPTQRHWALHFEWGRTYLHVVRLHGSLREHLAEPRAVREAASAGGSEADAGDGGWHDGSPVERGRGIELSTPRVMIPRVPRREQKEVASEWLRGSAGEALWPTGNRATRCGP